MAMKIPGGSVSAGHHGAARPHLRARHLSLKGNGAYGSLKGGGGAFGDPSGAGPAFQSANPAGAGAPAPNGMPAGSSAPSPGPLPGGE